MASEQLDFRDLVSRLKTAHVKGYLLSQGWEEKPSRYVDQLYFQSAIDQGGVTYELYFPSSRRAARYQTLAMRAIYKLCGIEDREPAEITRDMLATHIDLKRPPKASAGVARLRVRNSDSEPLQLRIDSPAREHELLPGEAIELMCHVDAGGLLEIERGEGTLIVRTPEKHES